MEKKIHTPITSDKIKDLRAGDLVLISGTIYTGRDAAHKRLVQLLEDKKPLPIDFKDQVIYYTGPTPAKDGRPIGSCGPTSSYRMDPFANQLMEIGLKVMIGKGDRSQSFIDDMLFHKGIYMQTVGGAGALLSRRVKKSKVVAFFDLGPEAIYELEVDDFPVIVTYDIYGGNLIEDEVRKYQSIDKINFE
jgi:fumarate hydratase subunit beta